MLDPVPGRRYRSAAEANAALERRRVELSTLAPRVRTGMAAAILATIASAAVYLLVPAPEHHQFARLAANDDRGILAVGMNDRAVSWCERGWDEEYPRPRATAMDDLKVERTMSIIARAHADVVQERFARIAGGKS
ncbi:MAG TPA: hypothetical protein VF713_25390 [Thermoanaerobaculia bacterium]